MGADLVSRGRQIMRSGCAPDKGELMISGLVSELDPSSNLNLPRVVGARNRAESGRAAVAVRRAKVRPVEQVERLEAHFEPPRRAAPSRA